MATLAPKWHDDDQPHDDLRCQILDRRDNWLLANFFYYISCASYNSSSLYQDYSHTLLSRLICSQHYKPQRSPGPSKPRWPVWLQISLNIILYIILFITFHHPSLLLAASHNIMNLIFYLIIGVAWKVTLVPYIAASKRHQYVANVNCSDNEETIFFGNRVFWWMCESTIKVCSIQLRRYNKFEQGQN